MPSGPEEPRIACHSGLQDVPPAFAALFGARLFDSLPWYASVCAASLPPSAEPLFVTVSAGARPLALFPMRRNVTRMSSLTTDHTGVWRPLTAPGLTAADLHGVARAFGRWCRSWAKVRLDALDMQDPAWTVLLAGLRDAGIRPLPFDHFSNGTAFAGLGWESYLAGRPVKLRETLERESGALLAQGAALRVVAASADLASAIEAYQSLRTVNKLTPRFPAFDATLMRACAAEGWLRLGLLHQSGRTMAAQAWVVQGGGATLLQSACAVPLDAAIMTGWMIRHLLAIDGVATLDFGRGEEEHRWASMRRQREGLILANPWRPAGLAAVLYRRLIPAQPSQTPFQCRGSD